MPLSVQIEYDGAQAELKAGERALADPRSFLHQSNLAILSEAVLRLRTRMRGERRTNNLARSLQPGDPQNVDEVGTDEARLGTSIVYANKVNEGGTIYPLGKALAIPLTDFLRNPLLEDNWPRDYDPGRERLSIMPTDDGRAILYDPEDERLRWLLVPSVEWGEGYHFLEWDEENIDTVTTLYLDLLEDEWQDASR